MKIKIRTYSFLLLIAFISPVLVTMAQDDARKKKAAKSCSTSCDGLSGLRKRSVQQNNVSSGKTPAVNQVAVKTK